MKLSPKSRPLICFLRRTTQSIGNFFPEADAVYKQESRALSFPHDLTEQRFMPLNSKNQYLIWLSIFNIKIKRPLVSIE